MSGFGFFNKHRTWEDWFGMLLGVLIVVSPWFPFSSHDVMDAERSTMILNTFVVGMLVFGLADPAFGPTMNGYETTRGRAGRAMLDFYRRYLTTRLVDYTKVQAG